jgi:hypothetical protein
MNYNIPWLNENQTIENPTVSTQSINILLVDDKGKEFIATLKIKDLGIDDKVLTALNAQFAV